MERRCSKDYGTTTPREFNSNGCFIVLMSFSAVLVWGGSHKCLGVLLPTLTDQFTAHTWLIGITISLLTATTGIAGIFVLFLEEKFGSRRVLICSTFMAGLGLMLIPLATSVIHIATSLAFLVGPAIGITSILQKAVLGRHFNKHYSLASGIGHAGHAVALLAFAPMMQLFLDTYGWRGAALLLAGVCMHPVACAALVRETKPQYQPPPDQSDHTESKRCEISTCCVRAFRAIDLKILSQFNFWIVCFCLTGLRFVDDAWIVFYVPHLQAKGFTPQTSAALCSAAGVGYFFGTMIFAPCIDRGILKCSTGVIINSLMLTVSLVVDPWVNGIPGLAAITFLYGLNVSSLFNLNDVLTKELLGSDRLTSAFAWIGAIGALVRLLAGFLPGLIYDASNSYDLAFIVIGVVPTVALIPLVIGKLSKIV